MADTEDETEGVQASKAARAAGVGRMLNDEAPPKEPPKNESGGSYEVGGASSVGESVGRSGEDMVEDDGKEPGRFDHASDDDTGRPSGGSTERDSTATES